MKQTYNITLSHRQREDKPLIQRLENTILFGNLQQNSYTVYYLQLCLSRCVQARCH